MDAGSLIDVIAEEIDSDSLIGFVGDLAEAIFDKVTLTDLIGAIWDAINPFN